MVHLAFRKTVGDVHTLGRETCLAPVTWNADGWPVVNRTGTVAATMTAPTPPPHPWPALPGRDDFTDGALRYEWVHLRNHEPAHYSLSARPGFLRLQGAAPSLCDIAAPTFLARRQQHFDFDATTHLDFSPATPNEEAGLSLFMTSQHHYDFAITQSAGRRVLVVKYKLELIDYSAAEVPLAPGPVTLRITGTRPHYTFACAQNGGDFRPVAQVNTRYLGTEVTGGYNGVVIALYATGHGQPCAAPADFDWFDYQPKE